jgi:phosphoglycerate kinase
VYSDIISILAEYAGMVVISHQGRKGEESFISLKQHWVVLRKLLPSEIDIEFMPFERVFSREGKERMRNLKRREVILIDNIRMLDEETKFSAERSKFIEFFKGLAGACINDAMPVWHRAHTSLMGLPYIAPTYIGMRAIYELRALRDALRGKAHDIGIVMGGSKLTKAQYLTSILRRMECFTGGLPGQLIARVKGYDLGTRNNSFIERKFSGETFETAKLLAEKFNIHHPVDFVVWENGDSKVIHIDELKDTEGIIMDIGPETVDIYAEALQSKTIRIRAGPLGVYEKGYSNGIRLTKRIMGIGLIFLGGDTAEEITMHKLDSIIQSAGGLMCLSGGAFLHGLAGQRYPSIDILINK